jgi:hypothetical protein
MAYPGPILSGVTIVFYGFKDDALKAKLTEKGALVRQAVSGLTKIVVIKDEAAQAKVRWDPKRSKVIAFAIEKDLAIYTKANLELAYDLGNKPAPMAATAPPYMPPGIEVGKAEAEIKIKKGKKEKVVKAAITPIVLPIEVPLEDGAVDVTYFGKPMAKVFKQGQRIVSSMLTKRNGMYIREVPKFFGYSREEDCFVLIVKVSSQSKLEKRPDAPWGAYDLLAVEFKFNSKFSFEGFRPMVENIPPKEEIDPVDLVKGQYDDDMFVIYEDK